MRSDIGILIRDNEFAEPIIYKSSVSAYEVKINAVIDRGEQIEEKQVMRYGDSVTRRCRVLVSESDIPNPQVMDILEFDKQCWRVCESPGRDNVGCVLLTVEISVRNAAHNGLYGRGY